MSLKHSRDTSLGQGRKLLMHAGFFRVAINKLMDDMETKPNGMPARLSCIPLYHLASHECELLLKAALLKRGVPENRLLRNGRGHDLAKLATMLAEHVGISESTMKLIEVLAPAHLEHTLRYGGPAKFPHPSWLMDSLNELLQHCAVGREMIEKLENEDRQAVPSPAQRVSIGG